MNESSRDFIGRRVEKFLIRFLLNMGTILPYSNFFSNSALVRILSFLYFDSR